MNSILIVYCSNHDYHFQDICAKMMCMRDINKDIGNFEKEFSIEHILISIKNLKARVKQLESRNMYEVPKRDPI